MVTYEAINMMFQFGMFIAAMATVVIALVALFTQNKK